MVEKEATTEAVAPPTVSAAADLSRVKTPPAPANAGATAKWSFLDGLAVIVLAIASLVVAYVPAVILYGPQAKNANASSIGPGRVAIWIGVMLCLTGLLGVIGRAISGRWAGVFIDSRNYISLSRVQMALWTVLVLSAFISAAFFNIAVGQPTASTMFNVAIPETLWSAMGISVASLIGTPILLSQKAAKPANSAEAESTMTAMSEDNSVMDHTGQVLTKVSPKDASLDDLFRGDETGNGDHVDLAKVQMFIFTVVLVGGYALALGSQFYNAQSTIISQLPDLSSGFVTLMLISHAGYLSNKAANHSQPGNAMSKTDWTPAGAGNGA